MTVDQVEELLRKYLSTGLAAVVILVGPATAPGADAKPQAHTTPSASSSTTTATRTHAAPHTRTPTTPDDGGGRATSDATSDPTPQTYGTDPAQPDGTQPTDAATPTQDQPQDQPQAGDGATAAAANKWGTPDREDDFSGDLSGWGLYTGRGHAGNGQRSPSAATVANGVLTIRGDAQGTTEGMAWNDGKGQKYGRWEARVKAPASDPTYNAVLLLWPDAENFPAGGEIDFMEMTDNTRQSTNAFLHYGARNAQMHGQVKVDATQWHNWAVEWTPKGVTTYVDGQPWWHTDDPKVMPPGPMHLCIQLDWFPKDGGGAVQPSQMQVDWVRQYATDGTDGTDGSGPAQKPTAKPTTRPTTSKAAPSGSVMRDVIRRTFGW